jgi:hypothetical protein
LREELPPQEGVVMIGWKRRSLLVLCGSIALLASGCMSLTDPFGHEDDFRRLQKRFTQYVRWGKVHEASSFVVEDQRAEFLALAPELSIIRFTDYEITLLEYQKTSAHVDVTLRGYRLNAPVEKIVQLAQDWEKVEETGSWRVRLELAQLRSGLGSAQ